MYKENYLKLNKFIGHNVELTTKDRDITYQYKNFNWHVDCDDDLVLMDGNELDCKTYIPIRKINGISNIAENMCDDVVSIGYGDKRICLCSVM
jgi:hypothetical protein